RGEVLLLGRDRERELLQLLVQGDGRADDRVRRCSRRGSERGKRDERYQRDAVPHGSSCSREVVESQDTTTRGGARARRAPGEGRPSATAAAGARSTGGRSVKRGRAKARPRRSAACSSSRAVA